MAEEPVSSHVKKVLDLSGKQADTSFSQMFVLLVSVRFVRVIHVFLMLEPFCSDSTMSCIVFINALIARCN